MSILNNLISKFKILEKKLDLKEFLIGNVSFKFPYDFNYTDQHTIPRGLIDFGRGIIDNGNIRIGGASSSHVQLGGSGLRFYWGLSGKEPNPATLHVVSKNSMDNSTLRRSIAAIASSLNEYKRNRLQFAKKVNFLD